MEKYYKLGFFPTPLHRLDKLSEKYGHNIYIKRDDQTGLATGGNKVRKLEYFIQEAIDKDCDTIVTAGAMQSNHCRQTAAAAALAGLKCYLYLGAIEPPVYNGNILLSKLLGANVHWAGDDRKGEHIPGFIDELKERGLKPYYIPYGGSNEIGALGYIRAVEELKNQLEEKQINIDQIFFASSSGGTHAGLIIGKELYGLNADIIGIGIDKTLIYGNTLKENIVDILKKTKPLVNSTLDYTEKDITVIENYNEPGYGVVTDNEKRAIKLLAQTEGIILDPVYTGRAFYGMIDMIEKDKFAPNSTILFWHTGGIPANFYYGNELID